VSTGSSDRPAPRVRIDKTFRKRLEAKPPAQRAAVLECIERVVDDASYPSLKTERVQGCPGVFSSRVDRSNRVTWERDGQVIVFRNHCSHDAVYRRP
jgi:hypothetical protein